MTNGVVPGGGGFLGGLGGYLGAAAAASMAAAAAGIAKPVASRPQFNPHLLLAAATQHCRPQPYLTGNYNITFKTTRLKLPFK